jgi:hypothetical protein
MTDCTCTKYVGCEPCRHDVAEQRDRYRAALDAIVNGECYSLDSALDIASTALGLDGEA